MEQEVEIRVGWKDILNGTACDPAWCPIALAVRREIKAAENDYKVLVAGSLMVLSQGPYGDVPKAVVALPESAQNFMNNFDGRWRKVLAWPFKFKIQIKEIES